MYGILHTMNSSKPKAYSYIRFSAPTQAKGDSYRRQHADTVAYCLANKLELVSDTDYTFYVLAKLDFHAIA
jgi:hypothetical protein